MSEDNTRRIEGIAPLTDRTIGIGNVTLPFAHVCWSSKSESKKRKSYNQGTRKMHSVCVMYLIIVRLGCSQDCLQDQ